VSENRGHAGHRHVPAQSRQGCSRGSAASCISSVVRPTRGASYVPAVVEILTSRVLLRPTDLGRSPRFYEQTVGLAIYREWGSGPSRGVVFFLGGGGLLELSGGGGDLPRMP
jgi:hypothetical protein